MGGTHTTGSGFNFRAEPFAQRLVNNPDTSKLFSSAIHGDPDTPLLRAYTGDTIVFRLLHQLMNESHVWTLAGHTFLTERYAGDANRKYSIHVGIAERYDLVTKAGGFQGMPGDYIHFNGRSSHFAEGGWGIIRVLEKEVPDLKLASEGYQSLGHSRNAEVRVSRRCTGENFQCGGDGPPLEVESECAGCDRSRL
jgi:manganese oxidase